MSVQDPGILYEEGNHFVVRGYKGAGFRWSPRLSNGFEVWRNDGCHSVKCATIGFDGDEGLRRAIAEVRRREEIVKNGGQ